METLLIASLCILAGYLIGRYVKSSALPDVTDIIHNKSEKHTTHSNHMPPQYYGYNGLIGIQINALLVS